MRYVDHFLVNSIGSIQSTWSLPEHETPDLEPWMEHKMLNEGWKIVSRDRGEIQVPSHGQVDWKSVAERIYEAFELGTGGDLTEEQQAALDAFHSAHMEQMMVAPEGTEIEGEIG